MAAPEKGVGIAALLTEPDASGGAPDEKVRAMRSMMSAIKSGDAQAAADSFVDLYHLCADARRPSSPDLEDDYSDEE